MVTKADKTLGKTAANNFRRMLNKVNGKWNDYRESAKDSPPFFTEDGWLQFLTIAIWTCALVAIINYKDKDGMTDPQILEEAMKLLHQQNKAVRSVDQKLWPAMIQKFREQKFEEFHQEIRNLPNQESVTVKSSLYDNLLQFSTDNTLKQMDSLVKKMLKLLGLTPEDTLRQRLYQLQNHCRTKLKWTNSNEDNRFILRIELLRATPEEKALNPDTEPQQEPEPQQQPEQLTEEEKAKKASLMEVVLGIGGKIPKKKRAGDNSIEAPAAKKPNTGGSALDLLANAAGGASLASGTAKKPTNPGSLESSDEEQEFDGGDVTGVGTGGGVAFNQRQREIEAMKTAEEKQQEEEQRVKELAKIKQAKKGAASKSSTVPNDGAVADESQQEKVPQLVDRDPVDVEEGSKKPAAVDPKPASAPAPAPKPASALAIPTAEEVFGKNPNHEELLVDESQEKGSPEEEAAKQQAAVESETDPKPLTAAEEAAIKADERQKKLAKKEAEKEEKAAMAKDWFHDKHMKNAKKEVDVIVIDDDIVQAVNTSFEHAGAMTVNNAPKPETQLVTKAWKAVAQEKHKLAVLLLMALENEPYSRNWHVPAAVPKKFYQNKYCYDASLKLGLIGKSKKNFADPAKVTEHKNHLEVCAHKWLSKNQFEIYFRVMWTLERYFGDHFRDSKTKNRSIHYETAKKAIQHMEGVTVSQRAMLVKMVEALAENEDPLYH